MRTLLLISTIILSTFIANRAPAQIAGTLDSTFNGTGKYALDFGFQENLTDVKVQPADQKVVVVGTALSPAFAGQLLVMRFLPDGTPDSTFNSNGIVLVPDFTESYAYESVIKDDGKILVCGAKADPTYVFAMVVMRFNDDGTRDSTFGVNGVAEVNISTGDDFAYAMIEQPDHKILLAGTAIDANFQNAPTVVRLLENGVIDSTFGTNGVSQITAIGIDNELTSIVIQPDGKIIVGGHYDQGLTPGGQYDFDVLVARFDSTGIADPLFGNAGVVITPVSADNIDDSFGLQLAADGKIVVGGFTTQPDFSYDVLLMQYDSTGSLDLGFGTNGIVIFDNAVQDIALDVEIQSDGKILLGGTSGGFFFDDRDFLVLRYNSNGTPDISFGNGGTVLTTIFTAFDECNAIAIQQDGKIVGAGKANNGNQNDIAVVRYLNDLNTSLPDFNQSTTMNLFPNPVSKNDVLIVNINLNNTVTATLELYNVIGSRIDSFNAGLLNSGNNSLVYKLPSSATAGIYFVRIVANDGFESYGKILITE